MSEGWYSLQGSLEAGFTAQLGLSIGKMEQRLLWAELRVSLVKFYGSLRPSTTFPANSHPWSEAGCRRPCRQGRLRPSFRRELFDFASQVALATAKRCFHRTVAGAKRETDKL